MGAYEELIEEDDSRYSDEAYPNAHRQNRGADKFLDKEFDILRQY